MERNSPHPLAGIGPVAMIAHGIFPADKMQTARVRALLAEAALQGVDLCFLRSSDCDPVSGTVRASRWREDGWQEAVLPLPSVVVILTDPGTPEELALDGWLRASTMVLGAGKRDKLGVASLLVGTPWERYLIPSEPLDPGRLQRQLRAWLADGGIVVKPNDGMRGTGVQFLIPGEEGTWKMVRGDQHVHMDTEEAVARIARSIAGRMAYRGYIVQRYIDTSDGSGRPGTIRPEVVRQPGGTWQVIRITGRISAPGKIISTISRGAALTSIEGYLAGRGESDIPGRLREIEALSLGIAKRLTESDTAHYYEWGFDLVADPEGRLWFLEANARPLNFGGELERATHVIAYLKSLAGA